MKVRDLINELKKFPNQDAEVIVQHWMLATRSDKVIFNLTKATGIAKKADGSDDSIFIETERAEEDI